MYSFTPVSIFRSMMAKHGLKSVFPMEDIAVMGIWELLPHLNKFQVLSFSNFS